MHPCVSIERGSVLGSGCEIHSGARIVNAQLGDGVTILNHSLVTDSRIENGASLGLIHKEGFVEVGSQMDEIDGLELIFEKPAG